jgi:integrase
MPRLVNRNPSYRKHRASGQAIVTIDGQDLYLGPYGSQASKNEYDRIIGEWLANGRRLATKDLASDLAISELIQRYWEFAQGYYTSENTGEIACIKTALKALRLLYGRTLIADFGPLSLKALREKMLGMNWSRGHINSQIRRIRRMFRWGVENQLVSELVCAALERVTGLRRGKTDARETDPVKPVPDEHVDAVLDHVSNQVGSMIDIQRITGMRPAEVCLMRGGDIDTTGKLWLYKPMKHKTEHHGHERTIYLGPKAQEVVAQFLKPDVQAFLFSPADAERLRREKLHEQRLLNGTPMSCGNKPGTNKASKPKKAPGERYTVSAYRNAIIKACEIAFGMPADMKEPTTREAKEAESKLPPEVQKQRQAERSRARSEWRDQHCWHPNQLRHSAATRLRKEYGLEAAQVILGHRRLEVTQIYAEKNVEAAKKIMGEVG